MAALIFVCGVVAIGAYIVYTREKAKSYGQNWPAWVVALGLAIATAEGYFVPGTWPERNHNPGDITDATTGQKIVFGSDAEGWTALYQKIAYDLSGQSSVYAPSMTLAQFAQTWTGGDQADSWARNVSDALYLSGVRLGPGDTMQNIVS